MLHHKLLVIFAVFIRSHTVLCGNSCKSFFFEYGAARVLVSARRLNERSLQANGFVMSDDDIGFIEPGSGSNNGGKDNRVAETITTFARLIQDKNGGDPDAVKDYEKCLKGKAPTLSSHPKYRSINGYGNNLKNPYWGSSESPFGRFGPKNYEDGIHSIKKSVSGSDLPSPRQIVTDVLLKAVKADPPSRTPNQFINLGVLYLTHDLAFQAPVEAFKRKNSIRCCSNENKHVLAPEFSHSACLPISVGENDSFYKTANVGCLNMVRAQQSSNPYTLQAGEILNKATSFMDQSIVYGNVESDTKKIRTYSGGLLRIPPNKVLPTDRSGNYIDSSKRLLVAPIGAMWPALFAKNHNLLAEGLAAVNPKWDDETLFQEARRINIAVLQSIIFNGRVIESVFNKKIEEEYSENFDASTTLEFTTAAYRIGHFYLQPDWWIADEENNVRKYLHSDSLGRIDLLENNFDDVIRGSLMQPLNFNTYTDEVYNKFAKHENGMGLDLISLDIQRGRDHGLPSFLDARRQCGLNADFNTFDDMISIFPQENIDLLKSVYDNVEDIDLYVGGTLETFTTFNQVIVGATFGCIIGENYRKTMGGDAYFYTHKTSPHPFTDAQIQAIESLTFNHVICQNSNVKAVGRIFFLIESETNPSIPCDALTPLDLQLWAV